MKSMKVMEIREAFLKFFESKGCYREKSSSLVPANDPTLLFTSAGMVQFKDVFTGNEKRAYTRATTSQRCLRAGGKHNDLDNVGFTGRHNTFFEMLGNFSFGDYFKNEAIAWGWELVTEVLGVPKEQLYVTIYKDDDEAYEIWHKKIGLPADRIHRFGEKDNFWSAGDVGPCGPCTEIYIDRGPSYNTGDPEKDKLGGDGDRYLEFYNLVFMQYNRDAHGNLSPLPKPSVDTGMGLERISSILQNAPNNYEIDIFHSIFQEIEKISGYKYEGGMKEKSVASRVVADHLRAVTFLIADGVLPSNEGRGYVLRRILRRGVRYGKKLGFTAPFMEKLVPSLVRSMGEAYPEIRQKEKFIREAVFAEEEKFFQTLEKGLEILSEELAKLKKGSKLPGQVAFLLYDSFGFPLDLTMVVSKEHGVEVDEAAFNTAMEKQRSQSRAAQEGEGHEKTSAVYQELAKTLKTDFRGYETCESEGKVLALIQNGTKVESISQGAFEAVFDSSPFYGESGGQAGDSGALARSGTVFAQISDVKKPLPELTVLKGELMAGQTIKVGEKLSQIVERKKRLKTMANHSATHLLHWALKEVLGTHVKQGGSLVNEELLRFDFTHFKALSEEEKNKIETMINEKIYLSLPSQTRIMSKDAAISAGAVALFGEKYDSEVRVVAMGDGFSTELCGGTHVENTSQIGCFVLVSESGISAGVRRIIGYTGSGAVEYLKQKAKALDQLRETFKAGSPEDVLTKVEKLLLREKDLEKRVQFLEAQSAGAMAKELAANARVIKSIKVVCTSTEGTSESLKILVEKIRDYLPSGIIAVGATDATLNKAALMVQVSSDLTKSYNAGKLIQASAPFIEGKGGGKPEQAQAGGTKLDGMPSALNHILSMIEQM